MAELVKALTAGTATRDSIWKANLCKSHPVNRPIRRALGLREIGSLTQPKFASAEVDALYKEIQRIATQHLPVSDLNALRLAWYAGTFTNHVSHLLPRFGKLWSAPMEERRLASCATSPLLVAGEDHFCNTDLFWSLRTHREFIALQLEHLAFTKAVVYHANHYARNTCLKSLGETNHALSLFEERSTEETRSLIVKLRLSKGVLRWVELKYSKTAANGSRKRKRTQPAARQYPQDDKTYYAKHPAKNADARIHGNDPPRITRQRQTCANSHGDDASIGDSSLAHRNPTDSALAGNARRISIRSSNQTAHSEAAGPEAVVVDIEMLACREESDKLPNTPEIGTTTPMMRDQLRLLLVGEFCSHEHSHCKAESATAMWTKSRELDDSLYTVWMNDKERIKEEMSDNEYQSIARTVEFWCVLRRYAGILGQKTLWHPLQDKPVPHYTFEQWAALLGGENQNADMIYNLTRSRINLGDDGEATTTKLGIAFATATKFPAAAKLLGKGIAKFNEDLNLLVQSFLH